VAQEVIISRMGELAHTHDTAVHQSASVERTNERLLEIMVCHVMCWLCCCPTVSLGDRYFVQCVWL